MNRKIESAEPDGCRRRLSVEVEPGAVSERRDREIRSRTAAARLPGFRPGRAPAEMVAGHFREEINRAVLEDLLRESCRSALADSGLEPVADPRVENVSFGAENLSYDLVFDVAPAVELADYRDISLAAESAEVTAREVDETLEKVLEARPDLRARAVDLGERQRLRESLRERMEAENRIRVESEQENRIIGQLLERAKLDAPESLVEKRAASLAGREIQRTMPDFSSRPEAERESLARGLVEKFRPEAERDVKASFVIEAVAAREKVEVSDEEVSGRVEVLARLSRKPRDEVEAELGEAGRNDLRQRIRVEKTFDLLRRRCLLLEKPRIIKA